MITKTYERFEEIVHIIKLKNGMEVHLLPKEDPYYTTYVELSVPYGALDLNYKVGNQTFQTPYGTAHFFEHKIFAMPDGDAFQMFTAMGVDANAMTSYNQTSYLFLATNRVMEALDHLLNMIDQTYFTEENINSEKNIIAEELKMYLDDPLVEMQNQLMEMMYHNHPIRYDIGGTLESIMDIDEKILSQVHKHFYHPSQRLIVIAGKMNIKEIKAFFKAYDQKEVKKLEKPKTIFPKERNSLVKKQHIETKQIGMNKMMLGIKLPIEKKSVKDQIRRELILTVGLNMLLGSSSFMYESLMKEQLINQRFFIQTTFEKYAEHIIIYAESKKIYTLKRKLIDFLTVGAFDQVSESDFLRFKKAYLGQFIFALNQLDHKAYYYGKYYLQHTSLFDVIDMLNDISYQEVIDGLKKIERNRIASLIYKKA